VGTLANLTVTNPIAGSITGNAATATSATSAGTASTATKLATARNINGVTFDGSGDITLTADAGTLTGTSLNATVTGSSLTSVGTLANLTVTNPIAGSITGNAATATTAGTASTATKLATARNINGVAFDGTGNITVAAEAGTLTGTSLNATVTGSSLTSVGTITSGVWSGTAIEVAKGGTGLTATGTVNQVLTSTGTGTLNWATPTTISIGAIGTSNTNGASIASGVISLTPADETNGGIVTTNAQTFAGIKTFNSGLTVTNQPFLPPVLTQTQVDAISAPTEGMILYNSTQRKLQLYSVGNSNIINDGFSGTYTSIGTNNIKQTFVVPASGTIIQIQLYAKSNFPFVTNTNLNLNLNGTNFTSNFNNLTTSPQWFPIDLNTPVSVVAGQAMYFTINSIFLMLGDFSLGSNSAYSNGAVISSSGAVNGDDLMFRILITPANGSAYWLNIN